MDKIIHLDITARDIAEGCRGIADNCPVAYAILRATGALSANVTMLSMWWTMPSGVIYKATTPDVVREFIRAFDYDHTVQPFIVDITPMTNSQWWYRASEERLIEKLKPKLGMIPVRPT
jgi:hypothetical protein